MRTVLKWALRLVVGLVAIVAVAAAYLWFSANRKMNRTFAVSPAPIAIPTDPVSLAEGKRLATVYCAHCHGENFGGREMIRGPLIDLDTPNLTTHPGSATAGYTDLDWIRTIRHGVKKDGRSLIIMPAGSYWHLSDADLGAIVGYLRTAPPVEGGGRLRELGPLGVGLIGAGVFDKEFPGAVIDHAAARPTPVEKQPTIAFGDYLVRTFGCYHCHGEDFSGRQPPDPKSMFAPNLTQAGTLRSWNEENFVQFSRTRTGEDMPWLALRNMTDDELRAIWRYLASLPAVPTPVES